MSNMAQLLENNNDTKMDFQFQNIGQDNPNFGTQPSPGNENALECEGIQK